ncbi:hypothetical protein ACFXI0_27870 [Kitasatospora indigofera]|uniref:hypothetical protein n=1 Tax=Kitasatospora indigofera TaxID=67307 RepID=UPI003686C22E
MSNTWAQRGRTRRGLLSRLGGRLPSYQLGSPGGRPRHGAVADAGPVRGRATAVHAAVPVADPWHEVTLDTMLKETLVRLAEAVERKDHALTRSGHYAAGEAVVVDARHAVGELLALVEERGWPTLARVGRDGCDAALVIAYHARTDEKKRMLPALARAAATGGVPESHLIDLSVLITLASGAPLYDPTGPALGAGRLDAAGVAR